MVRSSARRALAGVSLWAAVGGSPAAACTGEPVSVAWLADEAARVIVCDVAMVRSRWADTGRRIESQVTLTNVEHLKGRPDEAPSPLTLVFPGGTVGDTTMRLCCTPEIRVGQRWLIFLRAEYRTYPAAGMGQGIFQIRADTEGVDRLFAPGGRAVIAIDQRGVPAIGAGAVPMAPEPVGVRGGLRLHPGEGIERGPANQAAGAMTLEEFIERIRPTLEASRAYDLSQPAGRRIGTELRPVPLKLAPHAEPVLPDLDANPPRAPHVPRSEAPAPTAPIDRPEGDAP